MVEVQTKARTNVAHGQQQLGHQLNHRQHRDRWPAVQPPTALGPPARPAGRPTLTAGPRQVQQLDVKRGLQRDRVQHRDHRQGDQFAHVPRRDRRPPAQRPAAARPLARPAARPRAASQPPASRSAWCSRPTTLARTTSSDHGPQCARRPGQQLDHVPQRDCRPSHRLDHVQQMTASLASSPTTGTATSSAACSRSASRAAAGPRKVQQPEVKRGLQRDRVQRRDRRSAAQPPAAARPLA